MFSIDYFWKYTYNLKYLYPLTMTVELL